MINVTYRALESKISSPAAVFQMYQGDETIRRAVITLMQLGTVRLAH